MDAKKFMYCDTNVLNWNDSAGDEASKMQKSAFGNR